MRSGNVGAVRGPLHGIPIVFKDNYGMADGVTSAGSLALADSRPGRDAFVVGRLRAAGAIILGKTNMHELAAGITTISSLGGQTKNAYDQARCPGGSSGGTGAAIAANFAAVGWGSDTCGSIRIPAAFGSLFGLRPTQGLASRVGHRSALAHAGRSRPAGPHDDRSRDRPRRDDRARPRRRGHARDRRERRCRTSSTRSRRRRCVARGSACSPTTSPTPTRRSPTPFARRSAR